MTQPEEDARLVKWCELLEKVIEDRELDMVPAVFVLMAQDGYGHEAETLRRNLVALLANGGRL